MSTFAEVPVIALPIISTVVALACAFAVGRDLVQKPRPDRATWLVAFLLFAIAAGAEVLGETSGWTPLIVRLYYVTGAVLVVGFLALGQMYLTAPARTAKIGPGVALLMTAISVSAVWGATVDSTRLESDGWRALDRTTGVTLLAIGINSLGTLVLVGGLIYSVIRFRQLGTMRNRMIGCLLIAVGTLTVAAGGTLTRFGSDEYLYIAMSAGILLIFTGYLWTKVPEGSGLRKPRSGPAEVFRIPGLPINDGRAAGLVYVEQMLARLDDAAISEEARIWSVPGRPVDAFSRSEARRVWQVRLRLSTEAQAAFDSRSPMIRLQLTDLLTDVFGTEGARLERPTPVEIVTHRDETVRTGTGSVD